jgi:hypothetical protein
MIAESEKEIPNLWLPFDSHMKVMNFGLVFFCHRLHGARRKALVSLNRLSS